MATMKKTLITLAAAAAAGTVVYVTIPPAPVVPMIGLGWTPNYQATNEVTVILSSTNLLTPMTNWVVKFVGRTNQCWLPMTNQQEFFFAVNVLTTNS